MSLNNLANHQSESGDRAGALTVWEAIWNELPPASRAELAISRCLWRSGTGDHEGALADLIFAAGNADDHADDPRLLGAARRRVRALVSQYATELSGTARTGLPHWATEPIDDQLVELLNTWLTDSRWPAREDLLRTRWAALTAPGNQAALAALTHLHPDNTELQFLADIVSDAQTRGLDTTLTDLRHQDDMANLIRDWVATPTWSASQRFLAEHPTLLTDPLAATLLETAHTDPAAQQHRAILQLAHTLPISDIYDAILDAADARDLLMRITATGDPGHLRALWFATPHLPRDPFTGPFAIAVLGTLTASDDAPDRLREATAQAGANATPADRADALHALRALATNRPDHAATLNELAEIIATAPSPTTPDDDPPA